MSPSTLTPPLPSTLGGSLSNVPSFFINSFSIPPFLLPIYQAAGAAYGIPWQVLAAINEVETDYGRDLSVSSAGAEGWMQFLPSEWSQYGVDVNNSGYEDPYNPADAIFAAARYLKQAGGDTDIRTAVLAYNHSQAYVESVMLRARLLGGTPPELLGAITGLTEARFPVYAASHYSDGFPTTEGPSPHTVPATTIYTQAGAPVIAAQDGHITQIDPTGPFGPSISLVDAYGNTYTYAGLGTLASLYPVLESVEAGAPRAAGLSKCRPGQWPVKPGRKRCDSDLQGRLGERLPAPTARRGAGDRRHRARPRRLRSRTSHRLSDPPGRYRRAADRSEADSRRLGQAAKLLRRESYGSHAICQAHAKSRTGAARVKDPA